MSPKYEALSHKKRTDYTLIDFNKTLSRPNIVKETDNFLIGPNAIKQ